MFRILVAKEQVHGCNLKFQRLAMPIQSKVKQYTANELDLGLISNKAYEGHCYGCVMSLLGYGALVRACFRWFH